MSNVKRQTSYQRQMSNVMYFVKSVDLVRSQLILWDLSRSCEICLPYETGTFARADDEPKADTEIFGETPSAGFSDTGTDDYDYDFGEDDIFGGGEDAAGGDDYAEDEIFGDR